MKNKNWFKYTFILGLLCLISAFGLNYFTTISDNIFKKLEGLGFTLIFIPLLLDFLSNVLKPKINSI